MIKQVAEIKSKVAKVREIMSTATATAEAGGGMIKVTAAGDQRIIKIEIDPEIVNPDDLEMLQDLIIAGVNKALADAMEAGKNAIRDHTDRILPEDMDLPKFDI